MPAEARTTLRIVWDTSSGSELTAGISVYGLAPRGRYVPDPLPTELWPKGCMAQYRRFAGESWEIPAWSIKIPNWPAQESWPGILRDTLRSLIESGCRVAWMSTEFEMCNPPGLFVPESTGGVGAALTSDGDFVRAVDLDQPLEDLDDEQMVRLRHYAKGLADVE